MGFLDDLEGTIEQHPALNGQQYSSLIQEVWQKFGNSSEIAKLKNSAQSQGLGGVVESWIKPGQNQAINAGQAKGLVGEGWIKEIVDRTGIPESVVAEAVAKILPGVVGKSASQGNSQAA